MNNDILLKIENCIRNKETSLNLSGLNLKYIPKEINKLTHLKRLYLSDNKIIKIENLHNLPNLIELDLSINEISSINGIEELINLKRLDLSYNQLSRLSGRIKSLYSLEILSLINNNIELSSDIKNLKELKNLFRLELSGNQLQELNVFKDEEFLINLKELFVQHNKLVFMTIDFSKLQRIDFVNLCYNNSLIPRDIANNLCIIAGNTMLTDEFLHNVTLFLKRYHVYE